MYRGGQKSVYILQVSNTKMNSPFHVLATVSLLLPTPVFLNGTGTVLGKHGQTGISHNLKLQEAEGE